MSTLIYNRSVFKDLIVGHNLSARVNSFLASLCIKILFLMKNIFCYVNQDILVKTESLVAYNKPNTAMTAFYEQFLLVTH